MASFHYVQVILFPPNFFIILSRTQERNARGILFMQANHHVECVKKTIALLVLHHLCCYLIFLKIGTTFWAIWASMRAIVMLFFGRQIVFVCVYLYNIRRCQWSGVQINLHYLITWSAQFFFVLLWRDSRCAWLSQMAPLLISNYLHTLT